VILTFLVPVTLFALLFKKKKLLRKHWYILFSVGLVFALLLSFVSVWSVWDPQALSDSLHDGNYSGASAVSIPLWLSVYITPARQRVVQGFDVLGNVSFDVFIGNGKVLEANGTLSYAAVMGSVHVGYQLGPPFFSDATAFFGFLLFLFTLFDMVGFALGLILCWVVSKMLAPRFQVVSRNEPVTSVTDNRT
jgi:disulfide bond formation protein DsbB